MEPASVPGGVSCAGGATGARTSSNAAFALRCRAAPGRWQAALKRAPGSDGGVLRGCCCARRPGRPAGRARDAARGATRRRAAVRRAAPRRMRPKRAAADPGSGRARTGAIGGCRALPLRRAARRRAASRSRSIAPRSRCPLTEPVASERALRCGRSSSLAACCRRCWCLYVALHGRSRGRMHSAPPRLNRRGWQAGKSAPLAAGTSSSDSGARQNGASPGPHSSPPPAIQWPAASQLPQPPLQPQQPPLLPT
jgi:hypothetical protein